MIRIRKPVLALITLVAIFGGIALSRLFGVWVTQSTKTPAKIKTGDFAGQPDPADIRGSYTFADIEKAFAIPADMITAAFSSMDTTLASTDKVNRLESIFSGKTGSKEIGTDSIRLFVALVKKIPYSAGAETGLPPNALQYLIENGFLTKEAAEQYRVAELERDTSLGANQALATSTAKESASQAVPSIPQGTVLQGTDKAAAGTATDQNSKSTETHTVSSKTVTGATTFADMLSWGCTTTEIEAILGFKIPESTSTKIKDAVTKEGKSFGPIKTALQELVNKKNN